MTRIRCVASPNVSLSFRDGAVLMTNGWPSPFKSMTPHRRYTFSKSIDKADPHGLDLVAPRRSQSRRVTSQNSTNDRFFADEKSVPRALIRDFRALFARTRSQREIIMHRKPPRARPSAVFEAYASPCHGRSFASFSRISSVVSHDHSRSASGCSPRSPAITYFAWIPRDTLSTVRAIRSHRLTIYPRNQTSALPLLLY